MLPSTTRSRTFYNPEQILTIFLSSWKTDNSYGFLCDFHLSLLKLIMIILSTVATIILTMQCTKTLNESFGYWFCNNLVIMGITEKQNR